MNSHKADFLSIMQGLFETLEKTDKNEIPIDTTNLKTILNETKKAKTNFEFMSIDEKLEIKNTIKINHFGIYFTSIEKLKEKTQDYQQKEIIVEIKDTLINLKERFNQKNSKSQKNQETDTITKIKTIESEIKNLKETSKINKTSKSNNISKQEIIDTLKAAINSSEITERISVFHKDIVEIKRNVSLDVTIKNQREILEKISNILSETLAISEKLAENKFSTSSQTNEPDSSIKQIKDFFDEKLKQQGERTRNQIEDELLSLRSNIEEIKEIKEDIDTLPKSINNINHQLISINESLDKITTLSSVRSIDKTHNLSDRKNEIINLCYFMKKGMEQLTFLSDTYFSIEKEHATLVKSAEIRGAENALSSLATDLIKECPNEFEKIKSFLPENITSNLTLEKSEN